MGGVSGGLSSSRARGDVRLGARRKRAWDAVGAVEGIPVVVEVKSAPSAADVLALDGVESAGAYKVLAGAPAVARGAGRALAPRHRVLRWPRPHPLVASTDLDRRGGSGDRPVEYWRRRTAFRGAVASRCRTRSAGRSRSARRARGGRVDEAVSRHRVEAACSAASGTSGRRRRSSYCSGSLRCGSRGLASRSCTTGRSATTGRRTGESALAARSRRSRRSGLGARRRVCGGGVGAPVVLSGDAPPDFYVPDSATLRLARTLLGDADFGRHACTVAVAPAPFVCRRRYDRASVFDEPFFAPSPVVAALDLARDPARGREILEQWSRDLPAEVSRVW